MMVLTLRKIKFSSIDPSAVVKAMTDKRQASTFAKAAAHSRVNEYSLSAAFTSD
jgi:hypothetical protein